MRPAHYSFLRILLRRIGYKCVPTYSLLLQFLRNHRNADGRIECKDGPYASRALLVLEYNIKMGRQAPYSLVLQSYADGSVECKDGLNASRALLILEQNYIKNVRPRTLWWLCSLRSQHYADGRVECKDGLSVFRELLVLERAIFKRVSGPVVSESVTSYGGVG